MDACRLDLTVFHGKCGGDLDGSRFRGESVFFAPTAELASAYAEHVCMNGDVDFGYRAGNDAAANEAAFLGANPVVFPVRLVLDKPAVLTKELLAYIANDIGINAVKIDRYIEDFEDSCPEERDAIMEWLKKHGYDGAVLPMDLMPVDPGGDWDYFTSYVSFSPSTQVTFILAESVVDDQDARLDRHRIRV